MLLIAEGNSIYAQFEKQSPYFLSNPYRVVTRGTYTSTTTLYYDSAKVLVHKEYAIKYKRPESIQIKSAVDYKGDTMWLSPKDKERIMAAALRKTPDCWIRYANEGTRNWISLPPNEALIIKKWLFDYSMSTFFGSSGQSKIHGKQIDSVGRKYLKDYTPSKRWMVTVLIDGATFGNGSTGQILHEVYFH